MESQLRNTEEVEIERLFRDGLAAYTRGEWARAKELLGKVVRRRPGYERNGERAATLLARAWKQEDRAQMKPLSWRRWVLAPVLILIGVGFVGLFALGWMTGHGPLGSFFWTATPMLTATPNTVQLSAVG